MTDWIGQTLSKVKIEKRIGHGGMAEVYVGHHTTLNRRTVVKILYAHLSEDPRHLARFRTEAQAIAALRHPNIVQVFDFDVINGQPYIVMELLEGVSLKQYQDKLHERSLLIGQGSAIQLISKIAVALEYAHQNNVLHRDVKPANVMLCRSSKALEVTSDLPPDIEPVLTDFGLARIASSNEQTATGAIVGTPTYMSPEQVQGKSIDARTDVYALGVMAYEILSGSLPFNGDEETPTSIMYKQVHLQPPKMQGAGPAQQKVIGRALAKDPGDRYSRPTQFVNDLNQAILKEKQTSIRTDHRKLPRRGMIAAIAVGLASLICGVGIVGSWAADPPPEPQSTSHPVAAPVKNIEEAPVNPTAEQVESLISATPQRMDDPLREIALTTDAPIAINPRESIDLTKPDYLDQFNHSNHWTQYDIPDKAAYQVVQEELRGTDYLPEERYTWWSMLGRQSGNVYAEAITKNGDCLGKDSVGMAIRVEEESATGGYSFEISCDGHWQLRRHRVGKSPKELSDWTASDAIQTGPDAINRIGLLAYGNHFWLYVNDYLVGNLDDPEYGRSYGSFALFVRAYVTYDLEASFDDFSFWHIRYLP